MNYQIDHDYHIHSGLSLCSGDPLQSAENILKYAESNGLKEICVTDHFWDEDIPGAGNWYRQQGVKHILQILPLPQSDKVKFYFGCETEMNLDMNVAISDKMADRLDFIIVPTTHLHMSAYYAKSDYDYTLKGRAEVLTKRFDKLLSSDLPFYKVGIAHLTCPLICTDSDDAHIKVIDLIEDKTFYELFERTAKVGMGIELNLTFDSYSPEQLERVMRPYKIAKQQGCKFYLGSDAHNPSGFVGATENFQKIVDYLELTEEDKFRPFK